MTNTNIVAIENFGLGNYSSIYIGDEALKFIERHYESGTYATLHTFSSVEEALAYMGE